MGGAQLSVHKGYMLTREGDIAPLPAVGASAVWTYKAIYHLGGGQVGQWSDDVKISVMGR